MQQPPPFLGGRNKDRASRAHRASGDGRRHASFALDVPRNKSPTSGSSGWFFDWQGREVTTGNLGKVLVTWTSPPGHAHESPARLFEDSPELHEVDGRGRVWVPLEALYKTARLVSKKYKRQRARERARRKALQNQGGKKASGQTENDQKGNQAGGQAKNPRVSNASGGSKKSDKGTSSSGRNGVKKL